MATSTNSTNPTNPDSPNRRRRGARAIAAGLSILGLSAVGLVALPATALASDGPSFQGFGPGPTTTVPDPEVNVDLPDIGLTPPTTEPDVIPPEPPDPEVNPDLGPLVDDITNPTIPPEPPLPPEPEDDDEIAPVPPQDCEPFSPDYPVVDVSMGASTATVELSFQGDDQTQICVTPLVVASYRLGQAGLGGSAELVDHEVLSSEDLDDWLLTGDPATVTVDVEGCHRAVVTYWGVAIPLSIDGVEDPPHVLDLATASADGCDAEGEPGADPGGRLPDTGGDLAPLLVLAAGLVAAGGMVVLVARRRRAAR